MCKLASFSIQITASIKPTDINNLISDQNVKKFRKQSATHNVKILYGGGGVIAIREQTKNVSCDKIVGWQNFWYSILVKKKLQET